MPLTLGSVCVAVLFVIFTGQEVTSANTSLSCYVCDDKFTNVWDPYTDCQVRLDKVDIKTCLAAEEYCLVERITFKEMTMSIKRSCAKECWYGCRAKGFGVTQIMCTSCCRESQCNVGNNSPRTSVRNSHVALASLLIIGYIHTHTFSAVSTLINHLR